MASVGRVRSFDDLTKRGRVPILRSVAIDVLRSRFGVEPRRVALLSLSFNTLFRVDVAAGAPLVIRVCGRPRIHSAGVEAVEAVWLGRIAADLGWDVPGAVPSTDGSFVVEAAHPRIPRPVPCSLFTWVGGRPVDDHPDEPTAAALGRLLAQLHAHAATISIPTGDELRADRTIRFGDRSAVAALPLGDGSLLAEALDRADRFLADLWSGSAVPHLLHGDFGPSNVLRRYSTMAPIDFQDLQVGHAVQDVGLTIADLRSDGVDGAVVDAFRRGVADAGGADIDDRQVEALTAVRALDLISFALASPRPGLEEWVRGEAAVVRRWMYAT
jgi:Ser/Thr protein kinase RdoA (MazF antagonist)